jgi:hypothetical protein
MYSFCRIKASGLSAPGGFLGKPEGIWVGYKRTVIIVSVRFVGCAALRMAPYPVFQDSIPDKPSAGVAASRILADQRRIDRPGKSRSLLHW